MRQQEHTERSWVRELDWRRKVYWYFTRLEFRALRIPVLRNVLGFIGWYLEPWALGQ